MKLCEQFHPELRFYGQPIGMELKNPVQRVSEDHRTPDSSGGKEGGVENPSRIWAPLGFFSLSYCLDGQSPPPIDLVTKYYFSSVFCPVSHF